MFLLWSSGTAEGVFAHNTCTTKTTQGPECSLFCLQYGLYKQVRSWLMTLLHLKGW